MQFALKFFTLLTLVALVGSALGLPVANEETSAQPILAKRWDSWNPSWGHSFGFANGHWGLQLPGGGLTGVGVYGGQALGWYNGRFWNLPGNFAWQGLRPPLPPIQQRWLGTGFPAGWF